MILVRKCGVADIIVDTMRECGGEFSQILLTEGELEALCSEIGEGFYKDRPYDIEASVFGNSVSIKINGVRCNCLKRSRDMLKKEMEEKPYMFIEKYAWWG